MMRLTRMESGWALALAGTLSALGAGCTAGGGDTASGTGLQVSALVEDGTDVESVKYEIQPVSCADGSNSGNAITETSPLDSDQVIPGNTDELKNKPLDKNSKHLFADLFKVLPAGCYNVTATPVTALGAASSDCAQAHKNKVKVLAGKTTEIFMIAQCKGVDPGALDAIVALNHEPVLGDIKHTKFACGSPSEICIEASDPDSDPIEIVLTAPGCEVEPVGDPGCFEVTCHEVGKVELTALVYDQLHNEMGDLIRIEDWLTSEGYPNESHAQLEFHGYVDGIVVYADEDGDGYGDGDAVILCKGDDTVGYSDSNTDCDDSNPDANPGETEVCDQVDNNCDGQVDEDGVCGVKKCDHPWECVGQIQTCHDCDPGGHAYCFKTDDGSGLCTDDFFCAGKPLCTTSAQCGAGQYCVVQSCCGQGACVTPSLTCSIQSVESEDMSGETASGN